MSVRGPRGGRGRGRGRGGRGKTMVWQWESYTPGPEVYQQLWRIRKAPAIVTPQLPNDCPIPNAQTRILDRRQTENEIQRNFYMVEITYLSARQVSVSSGENEGAGRKEIEEVDLSRILEYVSPRELEGFENEQFRIEAEAEAEVLRQEAREVARRRLDNIARVFAAGKGSRMLSGLGLDTEAPIRGRPRGRGRGRGRGSWRGRGALVITSRLRADAQEQLVEVESTEALHREEEITRRSIAETDPEEEDSEEDGRTQTSPGIARSAFLANSALSVSPVAPHRRLSNISLVQREHPEVSDIDDSDIELDDYDARSMSSAAVQLRFEEGFRERTVEESEAESLDGNRHRNKRRRTESTTSDQYIPTARMTPRPEPRLPLFTDRSSVRASDKEEEDSEISSDESIPARPPTSHHPSHRDTRDTTHADTISIQPAQNPSSTTLQQEPHNGNEDSDSEPEEYVVEAVIEHFFDSGKKYYLVKWEGYEDSHDWLPEEDLEGAAELVAGYNERVRKEKKKGKERMR